MFDHPVTRTVIQDLKSIPLYVWPLMPLAFVASYILIPFLARSDLQRFPGPVTAKFTRLWLAHTSRHGVRSVKVSHTQSKAGPETETCSLLPRIRSMNNIAS